MRTLRKMIAPLAWRIRLMLGRATIALVNDATLIQELQLDLLADETRDNVERFQEYGFTSHPHPGAEVLAAFIGGNRSHGIAVAVDDRRYRPTGLEQGEVCFYTDEDKEASDHRIHFKRGKEIHLIAGASSIVMTPAGITITTPALDIVKAS